MNPVNPHSDNIGSPGAFFIKGGGKRCVSELDEGRIVIENNNVKRYEIFLKDHLGNTRAVLSNAGNNITQLHPSPGICNARFGNSGIYYPHIKTTE